MKVKKGETMRDQTEQEALETLTAYKKEYLDKLDKVKILEAEKLEQLKICNDNIYGIISDLQEIRNKKGYMTAILLNTENGLANLKSN